MTCQREELFVIRQTCITIIRNDPWMLFWLFEPCDTCRIALRRYWRN